MEPILIICFFIAYLCRDSISFGNREKKPVEKPAFIIVEASNLNQMRKKVNQKIDEGYMVTGPVDNSFFSMSIKQSMILKNS